MAQVRKILVIGATGMLGNPVTNELINAGFDVTILARNPAEAKKQFPKAGVEEGDVQNEESLQKAVRGKDAVYLNLSIKQTEKRSSFHTESDGLRLILSAAKKENVKRIAYLSSLVMHYNGMNGFNWWVFDVKQNAVQMIKESGIPWTIFYPSNFMESLTNLYKSGNKLMLAGESKYKMYFVSGRDYGKTVAAAFKSTQAVNKEYCVQGQQAFTADEAVKIFQENYREKLKIMRAPLGLLKMFAPFSTRMNYGVHILEALNNYPEKFCSETTWSELHKPQTTVKDYVKSLQ